MSKGTVVVAMSGGVDSSVSAALLVEAGYEVRGLMMRLWSEPGQFDTKRDNRCCTRDQMIDAHLVAKKLGIPFEMIDARDTFKQEIVDRFIEGYSQGITPNPCMACNRHIRFTFLLNAALERGADYLATGHYAQVTQDKQGRFELRKGADTSKDQSYVLSVLRQDQLKHAMFPVGGYTKAQVRELADQFGLRVAGKSDSQDLCFLADGDYRRFLRDHAAKIMEPGPIVLSDGTLLGEHEGLPNYTIGQRKGLGVSYEVPLYVLRKDSRQNRLIVGPKSELGCDELVAKEVNWIAGKAPPEPVRAEVKIRYKSRPSAAWVEALQDERVRVRFDDPLPDITPGQGAVIYQDDVVLGSGIIV
ncbi:MAG: tRNA 2-thiouridine(34) synthase MnmA [Chloroflexi bacterium]|nr:tRNA 2-thiouridine(34) synthase MnmA [Chloroflexota bacterium]